MTPVSLCPFAVVFGEPCPGCGMGRALWACVHGDFAAAFAFHPLGPVAFSALGALTSLRVLAVASSRCRRLLTRVATTSARSHWWPLVLAVTLGVWLARFGGAFGGPAEVHSPLRTAFARLLE